MVAAKPVKGIPRKPMREKMRDRKKFKPNNKFSRRRQERIVKKLLTK